MAEVKTEYAKGVLKGIDIVQDCFVKFVGDNPEHMNGTMTITDLIGFITIYRKEVEKDLEKIEAEAEAESSSQRASSSGSGTQPNAETPSTTSSSRDSSSGDKEEKE